MDWVGLGWVGLGWDELGWVGIGWVRAYSGDEERGRGSVMDRL